MVRRPLHSVLLMSVLVLGLSGVHSAVAQIGGLPGAFSRLGFGARGIGMGNVMTSITGGEVSAYYNPALLPWTDRRSATATFGILAFDRSLNFLNYSQPLPPNAGISAGIINAGVSDIDGRDGDGEQTGSLRTSENQFFLAFGVRLKQGFSLGINIKLYYYHLYTDVTSATVGVDFGLAYPVSPQLTLAASVRDVGSKYKWDTSKLYGQSGQSSEDRFPQLYILAASYALPDSIGIVAGEVEFSSAKSALARVGAEVPIIPEVTVRAGIDRIDLRENGNGVKPSVGFTLKKQIDSWTPALTYAYIFEPFATSGINLISLSVMF